MDIRCGELQSVMVNLNYWEQVWSDWNENSELEFNTDIFRETFHIELNEAMVIAFENSYDDEHKYIVMDNLVQEYLNIECLKINKEL